MRWGGGWAQSLRDRKFKKPKKKKKIGETNLSKTNIAALLEEISVLKTVSEHARPTLGKILASRYVSRVLGIIEVIFPNL